MSVGDKSRRRINPLQVVQSSPLESPSSSYSGAADWTFDGKRRESAEKRHPRTPNGLVLGDFVNRETKKKLLVGDKKRRINPTSVGLSGPKFGVVVRDLASSSPFKDAEERTGDNLSEIREGLRNERERIKGNALQRTAPKKLSQSETFTKIVPSLENVTERERILEIAASYSNYLREELPNLVNEFSFLFHLLTSQNGSRVDHFIADRELLSSVHNCSYFAVAVLDSLREFLSCLNISTLKLLLEIGRIEVINTELACFVTTLHSRKLTPVTELGNREENVPFSPETDAKWSYANETAFRAFKKQRDLFYEVLRVWQEEHIKEDWDFAQVLGARVRGALNRRNGPVNGTHLARLFCDQLIASCRQGKPFSQDSPQEEHELLTFAKTMNPEKFRKLQERFFRPSNREASNAAGFPGNEEFFRDFILMSNDAHFLELLKCRLTKLILEWNSFVLHVGDEELDTGSLDESEQLRFLDAVKTLRLLAKFLGLVTFSPFQSEKLPDSIAEEMVNERSQMLPHWDLAALLQSSLFNGQITLTVPWVIEYLVMADPVTAKLPWYKVVVNYLSSLARSDYLKYLSRNPLGPILIRVLIGWFLDQPNIEPPCHISLPETLPAPNAIDSLPLTTEAVFEACCPFMTSLNRQLEEFIIGTRSSVPAQVFRKITPVAAIEDRAVKSGRNLKAELEEIFLQNQAPSTKRTIDFVSERLASNVVKQLKTTEIKEVMEEGLREIRRLGLADANKESKPAILSELATKLSKQLREKASSVSNRLIKEPSSSTIAALLPNDTSRQVVEVCAALTERSAKDRVAVWMDTNTSTGYFYKELQTLLGSLERNPGKQCQIKGTNKEEVAGDVLIKHDEKMTSPVDILNAMKDLTRDLLNDSVQTTEEYLSNLIREALKTVGCRQEVLPMYIQCIWQVSFDMLLTIVILQPSVVSSQVISHFVDYWKTLRKDAFSANLEPWVIFCPRQMMLLAQSVAPRQTWDKLYALIVKLLEAKLVEASFLESQCVQLLKQEWPPDLMQRFGTCMKDLSEYLMRNREKLVTDCDEETTGHFLDWISWYCGQTETI